MIVHSTDYLMTPPAVTPRKSRTRPLVRLVGLLCLGASVAGVTAGQSPNLRARNAQAHRVEDAPVIDGDLSDSIWAGAEIISNFSQRNPQEGEMATERTEVRIIYE